MVEARAGTSGLTAGCVLLAVSALACTMAPRYERPAAPVPARYRSDGTETSEEAAIPAWHDFFLDARLRALIELALLENRDLRVAALRAEEVRAQYRIERAALFPNVEGQAARNQQRVISPIVPERGGISYTQYTLSVGMTAYELDVWGRVRSLKNRALEQYLASVEARRGVRLGLIAQVATQYFTLRALEEQVRVAEGLLDASKSARDLIARSLDAGSRSALDLSSAEGQVATLKADIHVLRQQRYTAENSLQLLLGQAPPADLPPPASFEATSQVAPLRAGLPSSLLTRRPDVREAEHALRAANAHIGAARAAFFPRISLTAAGGAASDDILGLFGSGAGTWQFMPQITVPLFSAGSLVAELDVAKLRKQEEIARYEKAIQVAFREVSDALGSQSFIDAQQAARADAAAAKTHRFELADARYRAGVDDYLTLLTAQQDLFEAQRALVQVRLAKLSNLISLYRALGGGFDDAS